MNTYDLIMEIRRTPYGPQRTGLIQQLEALPQLPGQFKSHLFFINGTYESQDGWTDEGFDSARAPFPRDIQLLEASFVGKSDIDNGGFHQFFGNGTGRFAPEMVEWFERAGLSESSKIIQQAIDIFGGSYSRSQVKRQEFLSEFQGDEREEYGLFYKLDDLFYETCSRNKKQFFEAICDRWLREVCGVTSLHVRVRDLK